MYTTLNNLPEATRSTMVELLNARLADAVDLMTQAKQAHWNVKGPQFKPLHELFDEVNDELQDYVDLIAERAVALGGEARGSVRHAAQASTLSAYPDGLTGGLDHVGALAKAMAAFGGSIRAAIDTADKAGDAGTADLFTEVSRGIDKRLWMVEAHLVK